MLIFSPQRLAEEYSVDLGIDASRCKYVITELQDNALRKLAARREFSETGLATFKVRRVDNRNGTTSILDIKCDLNELGSKLQQVIAAKLELGDADEVKCIAAGHIISPNATLTAQQLKNNQQLIVIICRRDDQNGALHDRIAKIKADVEAVVASQSQLMEVRCQTEIAFAACMCNLLSDGGSGWQSGVSAAERESRSANGFGLLREGACCNATRGLRGGSAVAARGG